MRRTIHYRTFCGGQQPLGGVTYVAGIMLNLVQVRDSPRNPMSRGELRLPFQVRRM